MSELLNSLLVIQATPRRPVFPQDVPAIDGVQYAKSWKDFAGMEIAVVTAYSFEERRQYVFLKDGLDACQYLIDRHDVVAGYNSLAFDAELLRAFGVIVSPEKHYDLLREILIAAYGHRSVTRVPSAGTGLVSVATANGYQVRESSRELSIMWQQHQTSAVLEASLQKTWLIQRLLETLEKEGSLKDPNNDLLPMSVRLPSAALSTSGYFASFTDENAEAA